MGFSLIEFIKIDRAEKAVNNTNKLEDLQDMRQTIGERTGRKPLSWTEFNESNGTSEKPKTVRNAIVGGVVGAGIGAGAMALISMGAAPPASMVMMGLSVGVSGAYMGANIENEMTRRNNLLDRYEAYLRQFEAAATTGAPQQSQGIEIEAPRGLPARTASRAKD